ncbi:MAG: hypothetical protein Q8P92_01045 [Candidatus Daviesbacteria bacterium]|nr:hypothetical protein [Candidatus Daviesbacteria bacterium]
MNEHEKKLLSPLSYALLGTIGFLSVTLITNSVTFNSPTFDTLYPKPASEAASKTESTRYNLNIIGVPKEKSADLGQDQGRRIFVPLEGNCRIKLTEGDFEVLDGNCTQGPAAFQLPALDPNSDGITEYSVWVRALGKVGGESQTTTCATDPASGDQYCSAYAMISIREKGKSTFEDVSKLLLYIYADIDGDGVLERYPLFDDMLKDYFWNYDNNGLKLLQMRFYPVSTNVN